MKFSLVIPVFNEQETVPMLFERCMSSLQDFTKGSFEIICVDDGSSDNTLPLLHHYHLQDNRFKVISLSRNFGHQAAILAGLHHAQGETIAIIDGDLQDPPEVLSRFYEKIQEGYDVVYAVRKKRKESWFKRTLYWGYYRLLAYLTNNAIPLDSGDFSMFRRNVLEVMLQMPEQSLFLRGLRAWVGFRQTGVEYERQGRFAGEPKYTFSKLFKLAYNGIFSFSRLPVAVMGRIGMSVLAAGFLYSLWTVYKKIAYDDVPEGFTAIILLLFLFSGIQLLGLGILGEYVLRIYDETRRRPLFIVKQKFLS